MRDRNWYEMKTTNGNRAEISIYDEIGLFGISAADFQSDLKALGAFDHLDLYINSPGGEVFVGFNIYNMLDRLKANITVHVDGLAASIASIIAMVGDTINMADNAMMMIHNPMSFVMGDSKELRTAATALDKMKESAITIYASKSGKSRDEIWDLMDAETWLSAQEAVDEGFADEVTNAVEAVNRFDLRKFSHPPADIFNSTEEPDMGTPAAKETEDQMRERITKDVMEKTVPDIVTKAVNEAIAKITATNSADPANKGKDADKGEPETEAQMRERITKELTDYRNQVTSACEVAGHPEMAAAFINEGKKLPEVLDALKAAAKNKTGKQPVNGNEVSARHANNGQTTGTGDPEAVLDTSKIYQRWNNRGGKRAA